MRALFLLALVSLTAVAQDYGGRFHRFCSRSAQGRSSRGLQCNDFAFFEAFPANGAGTTGVCAASNPTGAKGEAFTVARASSATCTRTAAGGTVTTGIADADLVEVSSNILRQEFYEPGVLGARSEISRTNSLLRFIEYGNAAWADVGTPTLTGSQVSPFTGTYATSAVQFDDNDSGAYEGRSQAVTVSAGAAYTMHCYVKAGTLAKARITLDGTAATITGLSTSTWSIIEVTDASSSGVGIVAEALNGDAASDTGTVTWGGCQVEAGSFRTSIVPTTSATVTRAVDSSFVTVTWPNSASISLAASFIGTTPASGSAAGLLEFTGTTLFNESVGAWRFFTTVSGISATLSSSAAGIRAYGFHTGAARGVGWGPNTNSGADVNASNKFAGTFYVGGSAASRPNGIIARVCVDPSDSRCR